MLYLYFCFSIIESVWVPPEEGFMTLAEYNKINDKAVAMQEEERCRESSQFRANAEEVAAKFKREQLKNLRINAKPTIKSDNGDKDTDELDADDNVEYASSSQNEPYGRWQTVVYRPQKQIDLQLPKTEYYAPVIAPTITEREIPVKQFKEKVIGAIHTECSDTDNTFKKRKLAAGTSRKFARKRLDDD